MKLSSVASYFSLSVHSITKKLYGGYTDVDNIDTEENTRDVNRPEDGVREWHMFSNYVAREHLYCQLSNDDDMDKLQRGHARTTHVIEKVAVAV